MTTVQTLNPTQILIDGLNEDLAHEYATAIQYTHNAASVSGLARLVLKPLFEDEVQDELGHAKLLAEKIVNLGGTPTVMPKAIKPFTNPREMLQDAIEGEEATIKRYKERIEQAKEVGDLGLQVDLEDMVADETRHKEEFMRILQDPNL